MSKIDDLRTSVKKEISDYDEFLARAKNIIDLVPTVHELKQEAEAKLFALNNMPEDALTEYAPKLLQVQENDQKARQQFLPQLPNVCTGLRVSAINSGSTSAFYETVVSITSMQHDTPQWLSPISEAFGSLAESKAKRVTLPELVRQVKPHLGEMFSTANDSVDKAMNAIIGTDQAAIQMRDVIEQLWGGLVAHTIQKCPNNVRGQHLEIKKEAHRHLVSDCLSAVASSQTLIYLLDDLFSLHRDLSPEAKNLLQHDKVKLRELYTRWILQIDAIVKAVHVVQN